MATWETVKAALPIGNTPEDKQQRSELWQKLNVTRSRHLALFELDGGIQKVLQCEELFDAKPVIRRAHAYAREVNPNGPKDKLEFCEFRLLLVFLKGLFEVYQCFSKIDTSKDQEISLDELKEAGPKLADLGVPVSNPEELWKRLKGTNETVDFNEFADWATRQGMAGQELLEEVKKDDEEMKDQLKEALKGWSLCKDAHIAVADMKALLKKLDANVTEEELQLLMDEDKTENGTIPVDKFIDSIMVAC
mmetsp:Transcript_77741/g.219864  ORF Transcript_77741/g.219864 Transcript_77741/m.219864 type:complete len:249 (+) Transcript_77741:67-813(+)